MTESLEQWVARLADQGLPAMAFTKQRIPELLEGNATTHADYQRVIGRDPGFTLAVFNYFASLPRPPKEPPRDLAHAIALTGTAAIVAASERLGSLETHGSGIERRALASSYSRAAHAAWYAEQIGRLRGDNNPEEMAMAGLLQECGEIALWGYAKEEMLKIRQLAGRGMSTEKAAREVLGFTLTELSHGLACAWFISPLVGESLAPAGAFSPRSLGVMLAGALARASAVDWYGPETLELLALIAEHTGQPAAQTPGLVHRWAAEVARNLERLPLELAIQSLFASQPKTVAPPPEVQAVHEQTEPAISKVTRREATQTSATTATNAPEAPGRFAPQPAQAKPVSAAKQPDQDQTQQAELLQARRARAEKKRAQRAPSENAQAVQPPPPSRAPVTPPPAPEPAPPTQPPVQPPTTAEAAPIAKAPKPAVDAQVSAPEEAPATTEQAALATAVPATPKVDRPAKPATRRKSFDEALTLTFRDLRDDLGLERILYAAVSSDRKLLKAQFNIGCAETPALQQLKVPLQQRHLLSLLLKKPQGLWLNPTTREKFMPYLPSTLQAVFNCEGFFIASIFAGPTPLGVLYGDCADASQLTDTRFKQFKTLVQRLCNESS